MYSSRDPAGAVHLIVAVVVVTEDAATVALSTAAGTGRKTINSSIIGVDIAAILYGRFNVSMPLVKKDITTFSTWSYKKIVRPFSGTILDHSLDLNKGFYLFLSTVANATLPNVE
jgi:hypothetical protein